MDMLQAHNKQFLFHRKFRACQNVNILTGMTAVHPLSSHLAAKVTQYFAIQAFSHLTSIDFSSFFERLRLDLGKMGIRNSVERTMMAPAL